MNLTRYLSVAATSAALLLAVSPVRADGLAELDQFLREVGSAQASFTQVVTSPKRAKETEARTKTSVGRFEFLRPGRFRFEYTKPFEQTIVADGETLWLYDVDLNQVTARQQKDVLGSTPAALIASGTDLKGLGHSFDLQSAPASDGIEWVDATPRQSDGQLKSVRVGFRAGQLAELQIVDSLGQRSVLTFGDWKANVALKADRFRFQPPAGADVIRP